MAIHFYKGKSNQVEDVELLKFYYEVDDTAVFSDEDYQLLYLQNEIKKIFQVRNLNLFLGAGCSSLIEDGIEKGIPSISGITTQAYEALTGAHKTAMANELKIDITKEPYVSNIEKTIEILQSLRFYLKATQQDATLVDGILKRIKSKVFEICSKCVPEVVTIYQRFFRRVFLRDRSLNTVNIVTPNYDLYNEVALESLGVNYCNGFTGFQDRMFNPSSFNYIYAEDIGNKGKRLSPVDNFAYLLKLHGSVSWFENSQGFKGLYNTKEVRPESLGEDPSLEELMIYPSPIKQNASLGSPYSDIFREFQKRIMEDENLLVTIGYSFSDEHINNIIFQALSSPRFRLVIFGEIKGKIKELLELDDPRIWIVGGVFNDKKIHYFKEIATTVMNVSEFDVLEMKMKDTAKYISQKERV